MSVALPRWYTGTVASGGEDIYYEIVGDDGPAVLLTHGAGGSHAVWFQQVPFLARLGYRVVTWDCRGFGNSSFRSGTHGCAAALDDMRAVLDAAGAERAHLVGQSMGGWWVTGFALGCTDRTLSLTLSNTVGGLWTDALEEFFRTRVASLVASESRLGSHPALGPGFAERDPAHAFLYQQLNTFHTPPMADVMKALVGTNVAPDALDATGLPVLVITGSDDELFPAALVVESASRLAHAQIIEIPYASHSAYFDQPDAYNAALAAFLER